MKYVSRRALLTAAILVISLTKSERARASDPDRVAWSPDWPRVGALEIADVVALTVGSYAINAYWKPPTHASWQGGILFDDWARHLLRGRTSSVQTVAAAISDQIYLGSVYVPLIVDVWTVALGVHQSFDVASQMLLMNMQSLGLAGVGTLTAEHSVARARPYTIGCEARGKGGCAWQGADNQSFYSGHAAATAAMAGLTCAHHQHLPLYGGGVADLAPCLVMTSASATTGVLRVVSERHWTSDVLVGWGVGAAAGYLLPSLLHYGFSNRRTRGGRVPPVIPSVETDATGARLTLVGELP